MTSVAVTATTQTEASCKALTEEKALCWLLRKKSYTFRWGRCKAVLALCEAVIAVQAQNLKVCQVLSGLQCLQRSVGFAALCEA